MPAYRRLRTGVLLPPRRNCRLKASLFLLQPAAGAKYNAHPVLAEKSLGTPQQSQGTALNVVAGSASLRAAAWLIAVLLVLHLLVMLLGPNGSAATAQGVGGGAFRGDASGVFVVPAQLGKDAYGAYLVDSRAGTIVLYQFNSSNQKLRLAAARTFVFDRYLENYNTDPSPSEIADLVSKAKPIQPAPPPGGSTSPRTGD